MISWIQKNFQQHFRMIFAILLGGTIISFIFGINAAGGFGRADRRTASRPFFGHNLASENDMALVQHETQLSGYLHQENANPLFRLSALAVADQLHLPAPTESELKEYLKELPIFANEKGEFDPAAYARFQTDIRKSNQEAFIRHVMEDDYRIGRVAMLLGGPGYIQPHEIKSQLERYDTSWTLGLATIDYKSFAPAITPTDADLTKFFTDNAARYEIQPQVSLRYADFAAANYLDKVTVSEAEIKAYYDANPARFSKPETKADPKQPATPPSFDSVRLQVELALKIERAARLATKAASDFTLELYNKKINPGTPAFEELLVARKITLKDLAPFSHDEPPVELSRSSEAADEAFKLNKDRPYSDAIAFTTGSVVLFWDQTIPARQPQFVEVKTKVNADYIEQEKRSRFVALGKTLHSQIEARLKAGDTFDKAIAAVSASAATKIEGKMLAPFTVRQRPQDLDYLVFSTLESLKKGDVSEMVAGPDKGLIVYAADKKAPDLTAANPMYKTFQTQLARSTSARNSAEYLRELADAELAKGTPAAQ